MVTVSSYTMKGFLIYIGCYSMKGFLAYIGFLLLQKIRHIIMYSSSVRTMLDQKFVVFWVLVFFFRIWIKQVMFLLCSGFNSTIYERCC